MSSSEWNAAALELVDEALLHLAMSMDNPSLSRVESDELLMMARYALRTARAMMRDNLKAPTMRRGVTSAD